LTVVSWQDRDLEQIRTIVDDDALTFCCENKVCANKHNAVRSATDQAADSTKTFPVMNGLQQTVTAKHIPSELHLLK